MHMNFVILVLHNKGNKGAWKGKISTYLWFVHGEENDCETVFRRFGSQNPKLSRLEIGNLTWQWRNWGSIVECSPSRC